MTRQPQRKMRGALYNGLTERLAILLYNLWDNENRPDVSRKDVLQCFYGSKYRAHYGSHPLPPWWQMLGEKHSRANVKPIENWTIPEKKFIIALVKDGIELDTIKKCFGITAQFVTNLEKIKPFMEENRGGFVPVMETEDGDEAQIPVSNNDEEFDVYSISDTIMRKYANTQMAIYKAKVDFSNPVNVSTVRSMIVLQIRLRTLERQLANPDLSDAKLDEVRKSYETLRTTYSKASNDVAMLESQKEMIREGETFDDVLLHIKEALREWRDVEMPIRLEESGLIEEMVKLHKVDMGANPEKNVKAVERKDPNKTRNTDPFFVIGTFNKQSSEMMPIESDGEE
jgi:predicted RNase H-like HicB family nuclease